MRLAVLVAVLVVSLSLGGCLTGVRDIVQPAARTTRVFTCAVLDEEPETLRFDVFVEEGVAYSPVASVDLLRDTLAEHGRRTRDSIDVRITSVKGPEPGWTDEGWEEVLQDHDFLEGFDTVVLSIYWLRSVPEAVEVVRPGVVAVGQQQLVAKAQAMTWETDPTAHALLLHGVGHALGVVNRGIPMQANHEGAPGHSSDPSTVMHSSWEGPSAAQTAPNGTYDDYSPAVLADWNAALDDPSVCP